MKRAVTESHVESDVANRAAVRLSGRKAARGVFLVASLAAVACNGGSGGGTSGSGGAAGASGAAGAGGASGAAGASGSAGTAGTSGGDAGLGPAPNIPACDFGPAKPWQSAPNVPEWFNPCTGQMDVGLASLFLYHSDLAQLTDPNVAQQGYGWGWTLNGALGASMVGYTRDGKKYLRIVDGDLSSQEFVEVAGPSTILAPCDLDGAPAPQTHWVPTTPYVLSTLHFDANKNQWIYRRAADEYRMRFKGAPVVRPAGPLALAGLATVDVYDLQSVLDGAGVGSTFEHDAASGRLLSTKDKWGNESVFTYANGKLATVSLAHSATLKAVFDGDNLAGIEYPATPDDGPEGPARDVVTYSGHLISTIAISGNPPATYEFHPADASGRAKFKSVTDRFGAVFRAEYDGRLVKTFDRFDRPLVSMRFFDGDVNSVVGEWTDLRGFVTRTQRNSEGYLTSVTDVRAGTTLTYAPSDAPVGTVIVTQPISRTETETEKRIYGTTIASLNRPVRIEKIRTDGIPFETQTVTYHDAPTPETCWAFRKMTKFEKEVTSAEGPRVDIATTTFTGAVGSERTIAETYNNASVINQTTVIRADGRDQVRRSQNGSTTTFEYNANGFNTKVHTVFGQHETILERIPHGVFKLLPQSEAVLTPHKDPMGMPTGGVGRKTMKFDYDARGAISLRQLYRQNETVPRTELRYKRDRGGRAVEVNEFDRAYTYGEFLLGAIDSRYKRFSASYWPMQSSGDSPGARVIRSEVTDLGNRRLNWERVWPGKKVDEP
ncbi:MAG: hypothetical protein U0169_18055 [Polyangiaceae bacterium]